MTKNFFNKLFFLFIILLFSSITANAEGYIFSTTESFIIPRSSSIETISYENNVYAVNSLEEIQHLINSGIVKNYEPNSRMELFEYTPSDPYYSYQPNLKEVLAPFAWNKNLFGNDIKIAIIDTGIAPNIKDFNYDNIIKAEDYTPTKSTSFCEDDVNLDHGTKVASVIAACHNNIGLSGFAPNAKLYIFKYSYYDYTPVFDEEGNVVTDDDGKVVVVGETGYTKNIIQGIYDAVNKYDCDIINISSGTKTNSPELRAAVAYAEQKGVTVVASAGNYGSDTLYYPASYDSVVGVGFSNQKGYRHSLSHTHEYVNIIAPAGPIYVITRKNASPYKEFTGSSFSAPTVAAAVALAKQLKGDLTPAQIRHALYTTAEQMYDDPETTYIDESEGIGYGQLNIQAFLTYIKAIDSENLVYSLNGDTSYMAYHPPAGYKNYFASYADNSLINVFSTSDSTYIKGDKSYLDSLKLFGWKMPNLLPNKSSILKEEY